MNQNLIAAKAAKNDEFYTQFHDVQSEIDRYLEWDSNLFKGKTVMLPCDDPEWSNFTKFFAQNFENYGLKKLISTSYAPNSKSCPIKYSPTDIEISNPNFNEEKSLTKGKIFTLTRKEIKKGKLDIKDLEWEYLKGDGDFRSEEVSMLRDEADFIVTNPPFSLFREFLAWIVEADKRFLILGNMNAITYKEVFPLIKDNLIWLGVRNGPKEYLKPNGGIQKMGNTVWFTNVEHGKRHSPLRLNSKAENLRFNTNLKSITYQKYDNYDAIEVPSTLLIPNDYEGVMGVPISFLDKYCPEQFEIVGMCENMDLYNLKTKVYSSEECKEAYLVKFGRSGTYDLNASGVLLQGGSLSKVYQRILIKHKKGVKK